MLESIAKNIATTIFLICAMLINSIIPDKPSTPNPTLEPSQIVEDLKDE